MENFMNKLVEKISAQDIIRANSQAEAAEAERIKLEAERIRQEAEHFAQEAQQYKLQLDQLKSNAEEYRTHLDELREDSRQYKAQLEEMISDTRDYKAKLEENDAKIHDVGVQVYRNVQAVIEKSQRKNNDQFQEIDNKLESLQVIAETKNNAVVPLVIVTLVIAVADLAINLLHIFGIL